jgi:cytoskeletal protein RodZ
MGLVGNYIRETRVNQGYSVEQFAQATRLQLKNI